jgi:glycosyltransferase involved in cell wall biosynthesis
MQKTAILALIPAWNEEIHIAPVVETTRNHLDALVVDDEDDDETPVLATAAGRLLLATIRISARTGR